MGWQDLLAATEERIMPWCGGRQVCYRDRVWNIKGKLPPEHGWYKFAIDGGREAVVLDRTMQEQDPGFENGHKTIRGYLVGDRLIPDQVRVDPDPTKLIAQTMPVYLVEIGLDRFTRAICYHIPQLEGCSSMRQEFPQGPEAKISPLQRGVLIYKGQEFPQGPEAEVRDAYQDRLASVDHIPGVTPALDLAFRWMTLQRHLAEEREKGLIRIREEEAKKREAAERLAEARKNMGTGAGRRALAVQDFPAAAKAALAVSGAELLDARPSRTRGDWVVQYRFQARRLECVCDSTMHIVDAGICLTDHDTGEKGDGLLTLESIPSVIKEALALGKLVVWRHVPGDVAGYQDDIHAGDEDDD